ncbi:MAG: DnaJ domain-containing protein [Candidatus Woesearchaeota archaeon]
MANPNYYHVLEVSPGARTGVIEAAYRVLMTKYHPDKGLGNENVAKLLNEAREVLCDEEKRKKYDQKIFPQERVIGNYQVLEKIAEGGFGVTYKAKHVLLEELACLKQNLHVSPDDSLIMAHEAKLLWNINHYSLPTLRDFFHADDGSYIFAMSYVPGPTLEKIVREHGPIDPEHASWITQRLLNALHYLHFNGVIHCDVKPNNIIIKPEEHNAVLVDYGFASLRPKHKSRAEGYTEAFAAPELVELRPPLPSTDLYSLALTMMYAFGGNPLAKKFPKNVPQPIREYFETFLNPNPLLRNSWEGHDLVKEFSDVRMKVFGRRESNKKLEV